MDPDLFRVSLRAIFAAIVAEIADKFLLLGVDRDHRLPFSQSNANLGIDVGELRIPVGVAVALLGLAVGLQAVTRRIEQFGHQGAAHLVALPSPAANASAAATRRRPRSSRKGATVKNRSRMGSTSITTTIYGMTRRL